MINDIKNFMNIVEAAGVPGVKQYERDETKITAQIDNKLGPKFDRLVDDLQTVDNLKAQLKQMQDTTKTQTRQDVAFLFDVEDAVFTRVIETKNVILEISKDPKPTGSPQYKKILEALEKHLTPDLIEVLEKLKEEHKTITQKDPAVKYRFKEDEEGGIDISSFTDWIKSYDKKLDLVKQYL
jgi:light-regulated signal transduction histidine kinase (bacteriophytochrome)